MVQRVMGCNKGTFFPLIAVEKRKKSERNTQFSETRILASLGFDSVGSPNRLEHKKLDKAERINKLMKDSSMTVSFLSENWIKYGCIIMQTDSEKVLTWWLVN